MSVYCTIYEMIKQDTVKHASSIKGGPYTFHHPLGWEYKNEFSSNKKISLFKNMNMQTEKFQEQLKKIYRY